MLVDLHLTTENLELEALLDELQASTLDAVCLVDFEKLPDPSLVGQVRESGLKVFLGAVVPQKRGHLLAFPPDEEFDWGTFYEDASSQDNFVAYARERGCALVACHPYHRETPGAMGDRILQYPGLDAVITVTAVSPVPANDMALEMLESLGAGAAGGTGASASVGTAATLFANTVEDQAQFVQELKKGDCWAVAMGPDDKWSSVRTSDSDGRDRRRGGRGRRDGRDRGGRDRGRRDRGGRDRGGRDRGGRDRGGRDRGRRDRGGRDRGGRDHGEDRSGGNRSGGNRDDGNRNDGNRNDGNHTDGDHDGGDVNGNR